MNFLMGSWPCLGRKFVPNYIATHMVIVLDFTHLKIMYFDTNPMVLGLKIL